MTLKTLVGICFCGLLLSTGTAGLAHGQGERSVEPSPVLRLQYRTRSQAILYVVGQGETEAQSAQQTCAELDIPFESIPTLETLPLDCSKLHTIIIGSNAIDYFGGDDNAERKSQVFATLENFVAGGGHLFLFGSFNGRNSERLTTFGIRTAHFHNDYFRPVPGRTEVLFEGSEHLVPTNGRVHSQGNFTVDEDRASVVMLRRGARGESDEAGAEFDPDGPVLATVAYKRGRVSYCAVEPSADGLWLAPVAVKWIARGAPTNKEQLDESVVVPRTLLRAKNKSIVPPFAPQTLETIQKRLNQEFSDELAELDSPEEELQFADSMLERAKSEEESVKRFVLTQMAWRRMATGGDVEAAAQIISEAADEYTFDVTDARLQLLPAIERTRESVPTTETAELLLEWSDEAQAVHRYIEAERFMGLAQRLAADSSDERLRQVVEERLVTLEPLVAAQKVVLADIEEPSGAVRDAEAKSRLGRFFALSGGDWELGLPLLAEGSNEVLRTCAETDLASPDSPAKQVELAELWTNSQDGLTPLEAEGARKRARHWYLVALPYLNGDEHARVEADLARLNLPRVELKFLLQLDGAGRLEISEEGMRWNDFYGTPVSVIRINSQSWSVEETPTLPNRATTRYVPVGTSLESPRIRKIHGRGMVVLQRNSVGLVVVHLNDVPTGSDVYEFVVELVR